MGTRKGCVDDPPDPVAIQRCLGGELPAPQLSTAERVQLVRTLTGRGLTDAAIAVTTHWGDWRAVARFRRYHRIPAGRPRTLALHASWWRDPAQRDMQVRQLAGLGLSDRAIASRAGVHHNTVWEHRHRRGIPAALPRNGWRR